MFSDKNYGLPKDLIEAAKRVHEKQLEEQEVPTVKARRESPRIPPSDASPETIRAADKNEKEAEMSLKLDKLSKKLRRVRENRKTTHIPFKSHEGDTKSEEVQFTEEELAEAFAIFLEENFHVDMLTEEDLDYIFENEFPQWLEEGLSIRPNTNKDPIGDLIRKNIKKPPLPQQNPLRRHHREIKNQMKTPSWEGQVVPDKTQDKYHI